MKKQLFTSAMCAFRTATVLTVLASGFSLSAVACFTSYTTLTPAQLKERGTGTYTNVTVERGVEAVASALTTLGYKVTVKDVQAGIVKTAPREIMVSSTATATRGVGFNDRTVTAQAETTKDELAWRVTVRAEGTGVRIEAEPRGFRNGSEISDQQGMWTAEIMDPKFRDISRELSDVLGAKAPATVTAAPTH